MKLRYAAKTDVGMKRTHNEDYFSIIEEEQLFVVADGMGGHACGEVASKMAADTLAEFYQRTKDEEATWPYKLYPKLTYAENRLICGLRLANLRIFEEASCNLARKGMGTTIVTILIAQERLYIAHVGDSRAYRLRNGSIQALTRDHSLLEEYKLAKPDMTAEEEHNFPHKNVITRALGMRDDVQVESKQDSIQEGDVFLLCCDGLSGMVPDPQMLDIVERAPDLERAVTALVDQANRAGGVDNITVILIRCEGVRGEGK